jgi:hypothetical protein
MQPISSWTGFVAEVQSCVALLKAGNQATHRCRIRVDLSQKPDLTLPAILSNRHGVAYLGDIQTHKNFGIFPHGSSSCAEDRLAHARNPRSLAQCGASHLCWGRTYGLTKLTIACPAQKFILLTGSAGPDHSFRNCWKVHLWQN